MKEASTMTVGCDLGDKHSELCVLDVAGKVVASNRIATTQAGFDKLAQRYPKARVIIEVGAHSRWVSEQLMEAGLDVTVANPRRVRLIAQGPKKSDKADAETLARLGRADPKLLSPVQHRGHHAQQDLAVIRCRDVAVRERTALILSVQGTLKSFGVRIQAGSSPTFAKRARAVVPAELVAAVEPILRAITALSETIAAYDTIVEATARRYPETQRLQGISGVGALTALAFVLTLERPERFARSRDVGAFLGLVPRQRESGESRPQLGISKAGDPYLRRILVGSAQYILGPFGPDTDLRRHGLKLAARGGKAAKKRAVVAVARKLAVLLHRLWVTGETYRAVGYAARAAV